MHLSAPIKYGPIGFDNGNRQKIVTTENPKRVLGRILFLTNKIGRMISKNGAMMPKRKNSRETATDVSEVDFMHLLGALSATQILHSQLE